MFNGNGALAVCGNQKNPAVTLPAVTSEGAPAGQVARTIAGRDHAFPLVPAYAPIIDTGSPVTGVDAWPEPEELGRTYYGLGPNGASVKANGIEQPQSGLAGLGDGPLPDFGPGDVIGQTVGSSSGSDGPRSGGGIDWNAVIQSLTIGVPNAIAAFRPQSSYQGANAATQTPPQPIYVQQGTQPVYDSSGRLISGAAGTGAGIGAGLGTLANTLTNFVVQNPLVVLGGAVALFLLMREPPRRR